jgi:hypothetical protein
MKYFWTLKKDILSHFIILSKIKQTERQMVNDISYMKNIKKVKLIKVESVTVAPRGYRWVKWGRYWSQDTKFQL